LAYVRCFAVNVALFAILMLQVLPPSLMTTMTLRRSVGPCLRVIRESFSSRSTRPVAAAVVADKRADLNAPDHADYVQERKAELLDLTSSRDPSALPAILSELNNQDPDIRQAALSAVVQVGNKDAIPALQNQVAWAEDPREKVAIQDAIDFLRLPPADQIKNEAVAAQAAAQP